eukprot:CAMPEP_0205931148 /NCGR_PEP_ID=MMETSP1325-20131115/26830_1 /ASSEMBLY_ACC=CAM_ASM_000708 /TAXON_ID=236786 /ORGANISM="Florenciella sp., Strain RCC1007" /LENGTH=43 /DNA_ID= /DNA_START= /DNA_END= /DNA_ORIENTATION=
MTPTDKEERVLGLVLVGQKDGVTVSDHSVCVFFGQPALRRRVV